MKKNGFAVAGILYPMLVLFLCFIFLVLGNLMSDYYRYNRITQEIMNQINGEVPDKDITE